MGLELKLKIMTPQKLFNLGIEFSTVFGVIATEGLVIYYEDEWPFIVQFFSEVEQKLEDYLVLLPFFNSGPKKSKLGNFSLKIFLKNVGMRICSI